MLSDISEAARAILISNLKKCFYNIFEWAERSEACGPARPTMVGPRGEILAILKV